MRMGTGLALSWVCMGHQLALAEQAVPTHLRNLESSRSVSVRSMGMAGTGLSSVTDLHAIYLNPALLGNPFGRPGASVLRALSFPGLSVSVSETGIGLLEEAREAAQNPEGMGTFLSNFGKGEGFHLAEDLLSGLLLRRFFLGVHQSAVVDVQGYALDEPRASGYPEASGNTVTSEALVYGRGGLFAVTGFSVPAGKSASFGLMARYGLQTVVAGVSELGAGTEDAEGRRLADEASVSHGFNVDLGLTYMFWEAGGGRFSAVARNVGDGSFQSIDKGQPPPQAQPFDLDLGLALAPAFRRLPLAPVLSLELHQLMREDLLLEDSIGIGAELGLAHPSEQSPFTVRVGHDLMDVSYGASVDLFLFRLEAASAHRRVYLPSGTVRGQRHYILRTSWDFQAD